MLNHNDFEFKTMNFSILKKMCNIHAPSGSEYLMTEFLLEYVKRNQKNWKKQPIILSGGEFQDSIILVFGKPKTAIFSHIDSVGFTVGYGSKLIKIGGPQVESGYKLFGKDSKGEIECEIFIDEDGEISHTYFREIDRGTTLTFKGEFKEDNGYIESCFLDNRLGVFNALKIAEKLENGIICFSCYEEHGGGSAQFIGTPGALAASLQFAGARRRGGFDCQHRQCQRSTPLTRYRRLRRGQGWVAQCHKIAGHGVGSQNTRQRLDCGFGSQRGGRRTLRR